MKKRLVSLIMGTIMVVSCGFSSFAAENNGEEVKDYTKEVCLSEVAEDGSILEVIGYNYDNGDTKIVQSIDGDIVSEYYVDRSEHTIQEKLKEEDGSEREDVIAYEEAVSVLSRESRAYSNVGTLYWNWSDGQKSGTCGAKLSFETKFNTKDKYNINGTYQNLAKLASLISGVFLLPASPASAVAKNVFSYLGFAATATNVIIPTYYVSAVSATVTHRAVNTGNSSHSNTLTGTQYTVTQTGYSNKTYTSGNYYSTSSFANRDKVYANAMYHLLFSYPSYSIKSWN